MIGRHLSHFYVIRSLGSGGSGVVYEAQDTRLPRSVALKVLKPGLATDATAVRRFRREANLAASLNHPNICTILDVDDVAGQLVIAMELLRGRSLRERLADGPTPLAELLQVGISVAAALACAHERGVLHGDITPANIFLTSGGVVKVLDFGLARRVPTIEQPDGTETHLLDGHVPGTVPYVAPERFETPPIADPRSDLYALGVVLYEMAAGARPFDAASRLDLIALITTQSHLPLRRLAPHHPADFEAVVDRLLAKRPADRYASARDVKAALESIRAAVLAPAVGAAGSSSRRLTVAVMPFDVAAEDAELLADAAEGLTEDLRGCLSHHPQFAVAPRALTLRAAAPALGPSDAPPAHLIVRGRLSRVADRLVARASLIDARPGASGPAPVADLTADAPAADVLSAQDQMARRLADLIAAQSPGTVSRPAAGVSEAARALHRGQHHWESRFQGGWLPAVEQFERAVALDPNDAAAHVALAAAYEFLGSFTVMKPKLAYAVARRSVARALEVNGGMAAAYLQLALVELGGEWDWDASEAAFRRALALEPDGASIRVCYSWLLTLLGREAAAFEEARAALAAAPRSRFVMGGCATTHYLARQYDAAIALCTECLRVDPGYVGAFLIRGQSYELQGRVAEALADLERAAALTSDMPYFLGVLGHCYGLAGRRDRAQALLATLDRQSRERYVPPQCYVFIHAGLGDREQALAFQERAYEDGASPFNYLAPYIRDLYALDPRHKERLAQMRLAI